VVDGSNPNYEEIVKEQVAAAGIENTAFFG